jgi:hypothetical protein
VHQTAHNRDSGLSLGGGAFAAGGVVGCKGAANVALLGTFNGDVECTSILNLGTVNGTVTTGAAARAMPSATLYDTYCAMGTTISFASVISGNISRRVVSATSNPFGSANAAGVYVIDVPTLSTLTVTQSRVAATLVVNLGLGSTLTLSGPLTWDAPDGMPALIVRGSALGTVNINGSTSPLSEATATTNFNPASTPYFGNSNTTTTETYPPEVHGLIHVIGGSVGVNVGSNAIVRGCIVADGTITINGGASLFADPGLYTAPPTGYITPTGLAVRVGTWRREQDN